MSPGKIREKTVAEKAALVRAMVQGMDSLPLGSLEAFLESSHVAAAAESYLRRGLEALLDLGRHLLATGFGEPVAEYAAIAQALETRGVLPGTRGSRFRQMAGYRNRLVHFYDQIEPAELYTIVRDHRQDLLAVLEALTAWVNGHPELVDRSL